MKIRLVIVEDNHDIRNGLEALLSYNPDFESLGVYSNAEDFIRDFAKLEPDVVMMDINLPGMNGIECVKKLKPLRPEVQYLMCTVFEDNEKIFDSLCAGATGYILKNTPQQKLFDAINDIYNGGSPMSSLIARKVAGSFFNVLGPDPVAALSAREREILDYLSKGYRYKEISDALFISIETVRTHIRNIYEKLHVKSRTQALNIAFPREKR